MGERSGLARVWLGPEPPRGAHSSIVGIVSVTSAGVQVPGAAMCNLVNLGDYAPTERWPLGGWYEWSETGRSSLIPWHRVYCVDWFDGEEDADMTVEAITDRSGLMPEPSPSEAASQSTAELYAEIGGYHLPGSDWFLSVYDWERLPSELKDRVVDAYFNTGKGWESEEYREAVRAAVGWVKANPR